MVIVNCVSLLKFDTPPSMLVVEFNPKRLTLTPELTLRALSRTSSQFVPTVPVTLFTLMSRFDPVASVVVPEFALRIPGAAATVLGNTGTGGEDSAAVHGDAALYNSCRGSDATTQCAGVGAAAGDGHQAGAGGTARRVSAVGQQSTD